MKNLLLFFAALCCMTACTREYSVEPPRQGEDPLYTLAMSVPARFNDGGFTKNSGFTVDEITPLSSIHFSHILYDSLSLPAATRAEGNHADDIYIVNYDHGFSIISDNPDYPEVLAFSDNGRIDASTDHPGMLIVLENLLLFPPIKDTTISEIPVSAMTRAANPPLISVQWGQDEPYNRTAKVCSKCGTRMVTGCVATALAQLMTVYKPFSQARWYSPDYSSDGCQIINVNWSAINTHCINKYYMYPYPNNYWYDPEGPYHRPAVEGIFSMVMHELKPDFICSSGDHKTGASLTDARGALKKFGLTMDATSSFQNDKIFESLNNGRPVLIRAKTAAKNSDYHMWIIDGVNYIHQTPIYYHCNWGQDGYSNGYFASNLLYPGNTDFHDENVNGTWYGEGYPFTKDIDIVTNIRLQ